jgi:monothiol glutaredoxin
MTEELTMQEQIKQTVTGNPIVLFMKGNANFPQCGFSGKVIQILTALEAEFVTVDVLSNDQVREGIKQYSNWPTIPQLYVKGEFIGGCDIITEMYESGELKDVFAA